MGGRERVGATGVKTHYLSHNLSGGKGMLLCDSGKLSKENVGDVYTEMSDSHELCFCHYFFLQ